jgi:CHAT domain-containing protein
VVSLWKVDDEATAFLMGSFYQHLARGNDRAGALREAMLDTRSRFQDPWRWAAFTFIGREP